MYGRIRWGVDYRLIDQATVLILPSASWSVVISAGKVMDYGSVIILFFLFFVFRHPKQNILSALRHSSVHQSTLKLFLSPLSNGANPFPTVHQDYDSSQLISALWSEITYRKLL